MDRHSLDQTLDLVQEALGERYLVTGPLAQGGMSLLLRGRQTLLDQPVAIKIMNANMVGNRELRERFLREARILASLQIPQITRVYDAGALKDGRLYLVLELLQGENLEDISERGPMSLFLAAKLLMQVCDGLIAAHDRGIIHRDLKPENVFIVSSESGEPVAKLLDFGIAKDTMDEQDVTGTYTIVGSPLYVPPEQIVSSRTVDRRADIWAMGIMLYQLVLQRHPFEDASLALLLNKIQNEPLPPFPADSDPMFEVIVERCLAKKPEDRYPTANELKEALASLAEGEPPMDMDEMPTLGPRPAPVRSHHLPQSHAHPSELRTEPPPPSAAQLDVQPVSAPEATLFQGKSPPQGAQPSPVSSHDRSIQSPAQPMPPPRPMAPPPQPGGRVVQKTIPLGRPFQPPPSAPHAAQGPHVPRGGLTVPLMRPFHLPGGNTQGPMGQKRPETPQFAEPPPMQSRRQAATVLVAPQMADRPMWPFVAFGVAIVLAVVAIALFITH